MRRYSKNGEENNSSIENFLGRFTAFRALNHKNFRLYFGGQGISIIGTWVQRIALTWLVYRLTNSAFLLGVVGFSGQIPLLIITPFAGVFADRLDKHKILLYTQALSMVQAFVLAALVLTNTIQVWEIITLSIILGVFDALDMPTRQSFMVEMVGNNREDLGNAIAINSSMVNSARLIGPSIAGILISLFGEGWCFLLNAISYIAVIVSLLKMEIIHKPVSTKKKETIKELKEGFQYAFGFSPIRSILLLLAVVSFMGTPIRILAPVFVKNIFHGGADLFGFLMGASGLGALLGAIFLMNRKSVLGLGKLITYAVLVFGTGLIAFALSHIFVLSVIFMFMTGIGMMIQLAGSNTMLQTIVDNDKRGRVMSLYAMSFRGVAPFGSLLAGAAAGLIGASLTLATGGIFCVLGAIYFLINLPKMRALIRPIYIKYGILPETLKGVETATRLSYEEKD
jgi:MFS family permease